MSEGTTAHQMGLYGALGSRYVVRGAQVVEVVIWADLTPFMAMNEPEAVEALAEYAVYQENPAGAKSWLRKVINDALLAALSSKDSEKWGAMMVGALVNECAWCSLLEIKTIEAFARVSRLEEVFGISIDRMVRGGVTPEKIIEEITLNLRRKMRRPSA